MALFSTQNLRFLVRGGLLSALKAATGTLLRPMARELTIATDKLSLRVGDGSNEYTSLSVLNPVTPSFQYKTETGSTADSDPGSGLFKWNHATQSSATFLYFDDNTNGTGTDLSTFFSSLSGAPTGFIHIVLEEDRTQWQVWKWSAVTDGTGYWKFAVTLQASTASLADNLPVRVTFQALSSTGVTPAMTQVQSYTVPSDTQTVTLSSLNLGTDLRYMIDISLKNPQTSSANYSLYYNGDTTAANYARQSLNVNSTSVVAARAADAIIFTIAGATPGTAGLALIDIRNDGNGRACALARLVSDTTSLLRLYHTAHAPTTAYNVTSITISAHAANMIGAGSIFRIYKVSP